MLVEYAFFMLNDTLELIQVIFTEFQNFRMWHLDILLELLLTTILGFCRFKRHFKLWISYYLRDLVSM